MVARHSAWRVTDAPIHRMEGETLTVPASNGTRSGYNVRPGYSELLIEPVLALRLALVPAIRGLHLFSATKGWRDLLSGRDPLFFDRAQGAVIPDLSGMTANDYLYIGTPEIIGGFHVDVTTVNAIASVLSGEYANAGLGWTGLSETDGTIAPAGTTLGQDGNVTYTVPTDWRRATLEQLTGHRDAGGRSLFWSRWEVTETLTALVTIRNLTPLARVAPTTDSVSALTGGGFFKATTEYTMDLHEDVGALEIMAVAAGATTMRATWIAR